MDDQKFKAKLRTVQRHRKKLLALLLNDLQLVSSLCDDQFTPSRLVDILMWLQEPLSDVDRELIRAVSEREEVHRSSGGAPASGSK